MNLRAHRSYVLDVRIRWHRAVGGVALAIAAAASLGGTAPESSAQAPAGKVEETTISSKLNPKPRRVWVYTPPGYSASAAADYDLLVVFDGREYLEDIALPAMLDTLLARGEAGPFVAVLIDNNRGTERLADLGNRAQFADFVAGDLVEWARRNRQATRDPHRTFVTGSSAGGLAAAYLALRHPEVFGNALSQSGAFWRGNEASNDPPYEWLTSQVASQPKRDVRFLLEVGTLESRGALGGAAPSILDANRHLHDALRVKGYAVTYAEVPDAGHGPEFWRDRLPAAIAAIAKPAKSGPS
jgi:enterochelin esterase-like enzyme